jgi:hypothetical protein
VTATLFFLVSTETGRCILRSDNSFEEYHSSTCDITEYNPISTLLFNTEGNTIKSILSKGVSLTLGESVVFMSIWFIMTTVTYGIWVPAGLFLPGIIIGCSLG